MAKSSSRRSTTIVLNSGFSGSSSTVFAAAAQALHRDFVVHARHHDLPRARFARAVHGEQVTVENARIAHAHAADFQQVVGAG